MKCPKCHYIGFDDAERCRNCGYDFSLAIEPAKQADLAIRPETEPLGPLADLALRHAATPARREAESGEHVRPGAGRPNGLRSSSSADLPLFYPPPAYGDQSSARPPVPRPPLAVRRATPEVSRPRSSSVRATPEEPTLNLEPLLPADLDEARPGPGPPQNTVEEAEPAGAGCRVSAALVDAGILLAVDAAVMYFTLRLLDLSITEIGALPLAPLVAFLSLLNGGYFAAFTAAGGQTIGKMAAGIRVVGKHSSRVSPGPAVLRTAAYVVSALPIGLGFLTGLVGRDRRALHDRLAETRVVKVS